MTEKLEAERELILQELRAAKWNYDRVSRLLGMPVAFLRENFDRESIMTGTEIGNPRIARFIVSKRKIDHPTWPSIDREVINNCRQMYDAGKVELATAKVEGFYVLYAFPRKVPTARRAYFSQMQVF
jgi:hypothetical protein